MDFLNHKTMLLSIQIPTVKGREQSFNNLLQEIQRQVYYCKHAKGLIEIVSCKDDKEMTIGAKRMKLYCDTRATFSVQIDDDDSVSQNYVELVVAALLSNPDTDCVTYKELCTFNYTDRFRRKSVKTEYVSHSLKYEKWLDKHDGFDHVRTPYHKDIIRTTKCVEAGVPDIRYNEDEQFAIRVKPLLNSEIHIDEYLYLYNYKQEPHNLKYGIK